MRAGRISISPGLENDSQIADICRRWRRFIDGQVQGGAQGADHAGNFRSFICLHSIADANRVVFANHLPEIARDSQVVMQAAVGDEKSLAAGDFFIHYLTHRDTRFCGGIAAQVWPAMFRTFQNGTERVFCL